MTNYNLESVSSIGDVIDSYMKTDFFKEIQNRSMALDMPLNENVYTIKSDKDLCKKTGIYSIDFRTFDYSCNTRLFTDDDETAFANYIFNLNVMSSFFKKGRYFLSCFRPTITPFLITIKKNRNIKHMELFDDWFHQDCYRIVVDKGIQFVNTHIKMYNFIPIGIVGGCSISDISVLPDYHCDIRDKRYKSDYRDIYRQGLLKQPKAHFELFKNCTFEIEHGLSFFKYLMEVEEEDIQLFINNKNKLKIENLSFCEDLDSSSLLNISSYLKLINVFSRNIVDFQNFGVHIQLSVSDYWIKYLYEYISTSFTKTAFPVSLELKLMNNMHSFENKSKLLKREVSKLNMFSNVIVR